MLLRFFAILAVLVSAQSATAAVLKWEGTLSQYFGTLPGFEFTIAGTTPVGVLGGHLDVLSVTPTLGTAFTIPLTDPNNSTLVTMTGNMNFNGASSDRWAAAH